MTNTLTHKTVAIAAALMLSANALAATGLASGTALPAGFAAASELAAMPDGGWLALDKNGLRLLDASGAERARLPMRARQLDTRSPSAAASGPVLATVVDANAERAVAVDVDLQAGQLRLQAPFPAPSFAPEAACLYRDAQQIDYLFLFAKDGQSEQWLLHGTERKLVRRLAMPPHVRHCRVDDATGTLFASEAGMGLWAYQADAEGAGGREAIALHRPFGKLAGGAGALALLPGGIAMLDAKGKSLYLFSRKDGHWQPQPAPVLPTAASPRTLALRQSATEPLLLLNDEQTGNWRSMPLAWTAPRSSDQKAAAWPAPAIVIPQAQTDAMTRLGDAADDPAIWVHPSDPAASRVLGTNKKQGLLVYDMQGKQTQLLEVGRLNNVDLRQNVLMDGARRDLAVATQRDDNTVVLFSIDAGGTVAEAARFPTGLDKIYGICVYQPAGGGLETFVNDKDGRFQHYRIGHKDGTYTSTLLRSFKVASQPEGCVADDRSGMLFIGEEKRGVWSLPADSAAPTAMTMVLPTGGILTADVEGMSLYHGAGGSYLVVSSQGSNSYVVLDAAAPHRVRGSFRIGVNVEAGIDGASETDGLDVTAANLGGPYAAGMLVVQDGYKRLPDGPQNFKYVAWADIARALKLP
jgi:3-phytase